MKTKFKLFENLSTSRLFTPPSGSFIIKVDKDDYNKETKTFSVEASSKNIRAGVVPPAIVYLLSMKSNKYMKFFRFKTDTDGSGEDIYGWWYKDEYENFKLLIIND